MARIPTRVLMSFRDEMNKEAFLGGVARLAGKAVPYLQRSALGAGTGLGVGGAVGGLTGAASGAASGYYDAKSRGESGLGGALSGVGTGAYRGAMIGGALGGATGLAAGGRLDKSMEALNKSKALGMFGRFGQRQLHSVTGLTPKVTKGGTEGFRRLMDVRSMGHAASSAKTLKPLQDAAKKFVEARKLGDPKAVDAARRAMMKAKSFHQSAVRAEKEGLTHAPGFIKHVATKPGGYKDLWHLGVKPQWDMGTVGKGLVLLPAVGVASEAASSNEVDAEGRGKAERIGRAIGSTAGYSTTGYIPLAGSEVLARGTEQVGGLAGRGIDALIGAVAPPKKGGTPPDTEPDQHSQNVEKHYTNAAMGLPPEDLQT